MFPPDLPNPFGRPDALKDTHAVPPGHVPELHAAALAAIRQAVASCRANAAPGSVVVRGEAGSGKTHLLAQLRDDFKADPTAVVVGVSFFGTAPGRMWRKIRHDFVAELLRPPAGGSTHGLTRILHARYPQLAAPAPGAGGLLELILGPNPAPKVATFLKQEADLPAAIRTALVKLYDAPTAAPARDWLRGDALSDDTLAALGLPVLSQTDHDLEAASRDVVLALCRLAGVGTTLVIGFDNLEAVQSTTSDSQSIHQAAWVIGELATGEGTRLVVTFIRPETMLALRKLADKPAVQRLAGAEVEIPWLGKWEHVMRLVAAQFDVSPKWRDLRKLHPDPSWPFGEPFLRGLLAKNKFTLTPRHLLRACRVELNRLGGGAEVRKSDDPDPIAERKKPTSFDAPWLKRRDRHLAQPAGLVFDTVIGIGLPWLAEAVAAPVERFGEPVDDLPDVNLLFRPTAGGPLLGVTCCDHDPARLWRRLDRLKKQWDGRAAHGLLGTLVVARRADLPLSRASEDRLKSLEKAGVRVLLLPREQYAELAAYQRIFTDTQAGNYTDFGRPVTVAEFADWAKQHLSSAVKELADTVFGSVTGKPAPRKATARVTV